MTTDAAWVTIALQLVPLLNWVTIVIMAYLLGRFLGSARRELRALREQVATEARTLREQVAAEAREVKDR